MIEQFKKYLFEDKEKAVSFDFDDTIFMLDWDFEEGDFARDENGNPTGHLNKKIAQLIKDYKAKGYKVYVITSRYSIWKDETENYLRENGLLQYIDDMIFTNGAWKAAHCKRNGVETHYDDDPEELRRLKHKGIKGVRVRNEKGSNLH